MKTGMVAIVAFAAGAGTCWLIKPSAPDLPATSPISSTILPAKSSDERRSESADHKRIDGLLSRMKEEHQPVFLDQGEEIEPEPTISLADYPKLLEALQLRAGLSGLSLDDQGLFGKLLGDWYAADPQRAANWVRTLKNPDDRRKLGEVLIATAAKSNYDEAIRLMQDFSVDESGVVQVPEFLMEIAAERGADELVKLCALSKGENSTGIVSITTFPDNFDFRAALDGFSAITAQGGKLATYPVNLLQEWAGRDLEAALQWYASHGSQIPKVSLGSYFFNLRQSDSDDELASKLATTLSIGGSRNFVLKDVSEGLTSTVFGPLKPEAISRVLAKLPEGIDQTGLRTALIERTIGNTAINSGAELRDQLLSDMDATGRAALMKTLFPNQENSQWDQADLASLRHSLISLGHPAEQVAGLIPDAPAQEQEVVVEISLGTVGSGSLPQEVSEDDNDGRDKK